ncbi:TasA family protein [Modestobacter versicolor]|uniref:TasA family protein n=1 Tax=Modestobacter versicolor TaxID=429133 RepID=UPI0034DEBEEE
MSATTRRRPAARVLGSVAVLAAAATVAGTGTFGTFTDSTTPLAAEVGSGTVSIDVAAPAQEVAFADVEGGWKPGDRSSLALDLVNTGSADLSSITLDVTAVVSSVLDTDTVYGLQVSIDSCDQPWATDSGHHSCHGTGSTLYEGPVVTSVQLPTAASLAAGGVDHLLATATLPTGAGNTFMGAESTLSILFTGTQRTGTAR